ncbi:MAG: hypothetical protein WBZ51_11930 [Xanthobacteraceae bacterium]
MRFAPGVHPEFGYLGSSPRSWRKAGVVISLLAVFGLAAEASGSKFLIAQHPSGSDPRNAMALAPAQISINPILAAENMTGDIQAPQLEAKSGCLKPSTEAVREDCTPGRAARRRSTSAMNTPPAIAAVPIGHRPDPAVLPREGAAAVVAALPAPAEPPGPADAAAPSARTLQAPLPTSAPVKRGDASAVGRSGAHSRGDVIAATKPTQPESQRRSADVSAQRQRRYSSARGGTLVGSNDVVFHRAYKEITALAQTLGVRVPRKWLDLAAEALE